MRMRTGSTSIKAKPQMDGPTIGTTIRVGMRGYTTTRNVMVPRVATTTRGECSSSHRQDPQLTQLQISMETETVQVSRTQSTQFTGALTRTPMPGLGIMARQEHCQRRESSGMCIVHPIQGPQTLEGGAQVAPEDLKAEGPEDLKAEGTWQYVTTVLAGETRTETFGFDKTNSNGGSWDAGAEISATVGEQVGLSFLAKEGTSITGTARASMKNTWNTAVSPGQKVKRKGTFRKGGALWQWQFHVTKHGHTVTIPANDFALTSSLAEKPKCYPGLSQDGWDYQMCVLGGRLH